MQVHTLAKETPIMVVPVQTKTERAPYHLMTELRDSELTFDLARRRCQETRTRVIVISGRNKPIMEFVPPYGDFREIDPKPLTATIGQRVLYRWQSAPELVIPQQMTVYLPTVKLLQMYEKQGGKI